MKDDPDGQAADAVSAYTQVRLEDALRLLKFPKSECPDECVFHDLNGPNLCVTLKIQWFFLNEICTDTHLLDCCVKDSSRKFCWNLDPKKYKIENVCLFIENKDYCYRFSWMASKWLVKEAEYGTIWKKLMKNVDLDEPTSFFDHVYLGWTQRECKPNKSTLWMGKVPNWECLFVY